MSGEPTIKNQLRCSIESVCWKFSEDFYEDVIGCLKKHGATVPEKAKDHLGEMIQHQIGTWLPEELLGEEVSEILEKNGLDSDSEILEKNGLDSDPELDSDSDINSEDIENKKQTRRDKDNRNYNNMNIETFCDNFEQACTYAFNDIGGDLLNYKGITDYLRDYYDDEEDWDKEISFCLDMSVITISVNSVMKNLKNWEGGMIDEGTVLAQVGMFGEIVYDL